MSAQSKSSKSDNGGKGWTGTFLRLCDNDKWEKALGCIQQNEIPEKYDEAFCSGVGIAMRGNQLQLINLVLDKKTVPLRVLDPDNQWLSIAVIARSVDLVRELLAHGANPYSRVGFESSLHVAAIQGAKASQEILKLLLEHGADANIQAANGYTPLHCAAYYGNVESVEILLSFGANCNLVNLDNETAWSIARKRGHIDIFVMIKRQILGKDTESQKEVISNVVEGGDKKIPEHFQELQHSDEVPKEVSELKKETAVDTLSLKEKVADVREITKEGLAKEKQEIVGDVEKKFEELEKEKQMMKEDMGKEKQVMKEELEKEKQLMTEELEKKKAKNETFKYVFFVIVGIVCGFLFDVFVN